MAEQRPFDDARLLYDRAQKHIAELNAALNPDAPAPVWRIVPALEIDTYLLCLNRGALRAVKPIVSDVANNLVHTLDQVVAECARINGAARNRSLYYPISGKDEGFTRGNNRISHIVGMEYARVFARVRENNQYTLSFLQLAKELSNTSKHWELTPTEASALGVTYTVERSQKHIAIPNDYFHEHEELQFSVPSGSRPSFCVWGGFRLEGLGTVSGDPITCFRQTSQHVLQVIEECEKVPRRGGS